MPSPPPPRKRHVYPVALLCAAALLLGACHGSSVKHTATPGSTAVPSTDAKGKPRVSLSLTVGKLQVQGAGPAKPFDANVAKAVRGWMNKYIGTAMAGPLFTGSASVGLVRYFSPQIFRRIGPRAHDRAALTDEGTPVMTIVTKVGKAPLDLVALEDHGRTVMVGAKVHVSVSGDTAKGPLTVDRIGNFVFESKGRNIWYISGYTLIVTRTIGRSSTTSKATTTTS
jgi:hypothetical protein